MKYIRYSLGIITFSGGVGLLIIDPVKPGVVATLGQLFFAFTLMMWGLELLDVQTVTNIKMQAKRMLRKRTTEWHSSITLTEEAVKKYLKRFLMPMRSLRT